MADYGQSAKNPSHKQGAAAYGSWHKIHRVIMPRRKFDNTDEIMH